MLTEPSTLFSDAADRAEEAAPGTPDDAIVWDVVENKVRSERVLSFAFVACLILAALFAGMAGVLALTTSESGPLVGVFISVTTVPAVGALCLGVGVWSEIPGALLQLGIDLAGLILAGTLTLLGQRMVWSRVEGAPRRVGLHS